MKKLNLIAAALLLSAPALAQDQIASLHVEAGTVMTSTGAEFQTAGTGEAVVAGERVMVAENSSVLVQFHGEDCVIRFATPGVHVVPSDCDVGVAGAMTASAAAATTASSAGVAAAGSVAATSVASTAAVTAGIVAGVVAASAAAMEATSDDGDPPPPISP